MVRKSGRIRNLQESCPPRPKTNKYTQNGRFAAPLLSRLSNPRFAALLPPSLLCKLGRKEMVARIVMVRPYVSASTLSRVLPSAASVLSRTLPTVFSEPRKDWLVSETRSIKLFCEKVRANDLRYTRIPIFGGGRRFTTGASHVSDAGSIDSPLMQSMENKIKDQLNAESVSVKDAYGDGRHVTIDVVSSSFEDQSAVNRQRMVYKVIWEELQNIVHAVDQMSTKTPDEASAQK